MENHKRLKKRYLVLLESWYNIREHNEPSGCEADIW